MSSIPATRPVVRSRRAIASRPRAAAREQVIVKVLGKVIFLCSVMLAVYLGASMLGHVRLEKARKEGQLLRGRLSDATTFADSLKRRVESLTETPGLERWASARGMVREGLMAPVETPSWPGGQNLVASANP